jgi:dipeptidase E
MKFYLSSYKVGSETEKLKSLVPTGKKLGFVPNALDYVNEEARRESNEQNIKDLTVLGIEVEMLDLQDYFNKRDELKKKINELGGIWVRGGNVFVLRQAMKLSGLDEILVGMDKEDFFYGGYSAGGCVLSPDFRGWLELVDDPKVVPYKESKVIWDGLGLIGYAFVPHYRSDHPESEAIEKVVEYCIANKILFKALRDGEVVIKE